MLVNLYLAQIYVPDLGYTIYGKFTGVHLAAGGQEHSAVLGRSFLRRFKMTYDGQNGTVILEREDRSCRLTPSPKVTASVC